MALYFFRISQGRYSGVSDHASEFEDRDAAWTEMKAVCANLLSGIARGLKPDAQSHMSLGHMGLIGMEERVRSLNGHFTVEEPTGGGVLIRATLPAAREVEPA